MDKDMARDAICGEDWFWLLLSAACWGGGGVVAWTARELWVFGPLCLEPLMLPMLVAGGVAVQDGLGRGFHWARVATFVLTMPAWAYAGRVLVQACGG